MFVFFFWKDEEVGIAGNGGFVTVLKELGCDGVICSERGGKEGLQLRVV